MNYEKKITNKPIVVLNKKSKSFLIGCIFIILFMILDMAIGEFLYYYKYFNQPDMHSLAWNDFYDYEENTIDVMFIGSSHARFAFDTRTFDNNLGAKTFNLSSSGQTPVVGYYALKEALKYQKPKLVVYETYWRIFGTDDNLTPAYFVYDYIKGFDTKLEMLTNMYGEKDFTSFLLQSIAKTYKYRGAFIPAVKNILNGRIIKSSKSAEIEYEYFTYYKNGFFGSDKVATEEKLFVTNPFKKATPDFKLDEKQLEYFKRTIELCEKNNIKVLMVTAPLPDPTMDFLKNYDIYSHEFLKIAAGYGIEYIDYNLSNMENHQFKNDMFYDSNHLNMKGTELLGQMLLPEIGEYLN